MAVAETPRLEAQELAANLLQDARSSDPSVQFEAVRKLAISGYSQEAAQVLTAVATDVKAPENTRAYAAMGLRNFTNRIPADEKDAIQAALRKALQTECEVTPDELIRTLLAWGEARFVQDALGDKLAGHAMEIDVLERSTDASASDRLWTIYRNAPQGKSAPAYEKRTNVGMALANRNDVRGIDILMTLLPAEAGPGPQYRNNLYHFLALKLGRNFGYGQGNYRSELEQAVPKMLAWWEEHRSSFPERRTRDQ